jgi:hypothetical protein
MSLFHIVHFVSVVGMWVGVPVRDGSSMIWYGGGGTLPALVPSCIGHVCRPPINLLHYCKVLRDYCIV